MPNPNPLQVKLHDLLNPNAQPDHIEVEVYAGQHHYVDGIIVYLRKPGDKLDFAKVVIEYRDGQPLLFAYNTLDMGKDKASATAVVRLNEGYGTYCMRCGVPFEAHKNGRCLEVQE